MTTSDKPAKKPAKKRGRRRGKKVAPVFRVRITTRRGCLVLRYALKG